MSLSKFDKSTRDLHPETLATNREYPRHTPNDVMDPLMKHSQGVAAINPAILRNETAVKPVITVSRVKDIVPLLAAGLLGMVSPQAFADNHLTQRMDSSGHTIRHSPKLPTDFIATHRLISQFLSNYGGVGKSDTFTSLRRKIENAIDAQMNSEGLINMQVTLDEEKLFREKTGKTLSDGQFNQLLWGIDQCQVEISHLEILQEKLSEIAIEDV